MAVTVETLDKLERRITLTLPADLITHEVASRLKRLSRTVKADGFRPGKVPMSVVSQRYGYAVQHDVMNDKVGQAFVSATAEAKLRVAGVPRIVEREASVAGQMAFDAVFEVYPEVKHGNLEATEVERVSASISDDAIDKTVEILRKQRRTFAQRALTEVAAEGDRVTIDFEGKIDGVSFEGGKAQGYQFLIGEGQMLEAFEKAVRGMRAGESKTFPLQFPADYHGTDVAGKEADFMVTLNKIEAQHLPELNEAFAKALGIKDGLMEALRADVKRNLEREVKFRVLVRNKSAVMEVLVNNAELDLPSALVQGEVQRMVQSARADMKKRGVKDADTAPILDEIFLPQAERQVRLGLVVADLVRIHNLQAKPEQLQAHIQEIAQSYEKPSEVMHWYLSDRERMAEVEWTVVESNVTNFVLSKVKVVDRVLSFDELMNG